MYTQLILFNKWVVLLADATAVIDSEPMEQGDGAIWLTKAAFQFHMSLRSLLSRTRTDMTLGLAGGSICTTAQLPGEKNIAQKGVQGTSGGQVTWNEKMMKTR